MLAKARKFRSPSARPLKGARSARDDSSKPLKDAPPARGSIQGGRASSELSQSPGAARRTLAPNTPHGGHLELCFTPDASLLPATAERSDLESGSLPLPPPSLRAKTPAGPSRAKSTARLPEASRLQRYIEAAAVHAQKVHPQAPTCMKSTMPLLLLLIKLGQLSWPFYRWLYGLAYRFYDSAPRKVVEMVFGGALAFFGGTFVASLAAIEAFRMLGAARFVAEAKMVRDAAIKVAEASLEDDQLDADRDGIADVDQIPPAELARRKLLLALRTVPEPELLQGAVSSLLGAYLAVLSTLRFEFARTTALALGMAETVKFPIVRLLTPLMMAALGPDLHRWVDTLLDTAIKICAMIFAWYLQMIISAFYSGLRGGKMFANALFELLQERGLLASFPCYEASTPFDPDSSRLDEVVGYTVAAVGFTWQITSGFKLQFPLNLIFLPLTIVEWFLRWQISISPSAAP